MFDDMQQPEGPESGPDEWMGDESPEHFENLKEEEGVEQFLQNRQSMPDQSLFDEQGNLRTSMPGAETPKPEDDDDEPSFLDFYRKSFQKAVRSRVASFKDAWSVLKQQ